MIGGNGNGGSGNPNGGNGSGGNGPGGGNNGMTQAPPAKCAGGVENATATAIDFSNNLVASPSPPGGLTPASAPQIVVFGWDDVESTEGITFVNTLYGSLMNPDGSKSHCNLNPNACYGEGGAPPVGKYTCGNGTLSLTKDMVTLPSFDMGNHTIDHLEGYEALGGWSGIPAEWKDTVNGGWKFTNDKGPGLFIDQPTWTGVISANDAELKSLYGTGVGKTITIGGFRAPRLEINDAGLNAMKAFGYTYDQDLEEIMPEGFSDAAIAIDTPGKKGFNWIPWPYTLDNGSPGIWNQQADDATINYISNYPTGLWEIPVYQVYVPSANGLGKAIADSMLKSDNPMSCVFPPDTAADQKQHCYLGAGELSPGDSVKEVTAFDFNTFIYSRMTADQWLAVMKHSFLLRYYGNRAPLTYGAHPVEYTAPYDSYTLMVQANNYGYRDVLTYTTYDKRQMAMQSFINWIKNDPVLSQDTYFLSAAQLAAYMKAPFDKAGKPATADTVATPDSNGIFKRLTWVNRGAMVTVVDGNTADIVFPVSTAAAAPVSVAAGVAAGSLKNLSHIDIKYTTDVPFRIRLLPADGSPTMTVLLAGVGGDRTARIRVKDFMPGPEATAAQVTAAGLVGGDYMAKVAGIAFESAATAVTGGKMFTTHIDQLTLHGADTTALCTQ
ncbi:MAG TPA: hypothetical protein VMU50_19915 [Polyangia bacterium]|nr:hypothetical protein [Polyangia bacterium]